FEEVGRAVLLLFFFGRDDDGGRTARAITTTDTFAKGATAHARIGDRAVRVNGFAKGSGMIEPNMATMLAFVFTDAAIPREALQAMLVAANAKSFNAITVDGDTSTSDTCLLFATGRAGNARSDSLDDFQRALESVMTDLAVQVVRDGEGASKLIRIEVRGARDDDDARTVAKSIANSPLVKTAIAGGDANWGRIVMAIGKSGVALDSSSIGIAIGGVQVTADGRRVDDYDEAPVNAHLAGREIRIEVTLGPTDVGGARAQVWTCDLTHGYIEINADYRT
ncbi:MAG: bifunctional glutamate N-acetyltransferase/amino-acid acetyltransferase ArgJ, partial [bacterium]